MRDNQEMATILLNSNLASTEQLNEHWAYITHDRDIGQILVDKQILLPNVYRDLIVYIDSLHATEDDDFIDTDSIIIPADTIVADNDMDSAPFDSHLSFEATLQDHPSTQSAGEDTLRSTLDPHSYVIEATKTTNNIASHHSREELEALDIPLEAFVVDLDDIEPHVEEDFDTNEHEFISMSESLFTDDPTIEPTPKKAQTYQRLKTVTNQIKTVTTKNPEPVSTSAEHTHQPIGEKSLPDSEPGSREIGNLSIQIPETISPNNSLDEILLYARNSFVSDVHLIPDAPITMRRYGILTPVSSELFSAKAIEQTVLEGLPAREMEPFIKNGDTEFVYSIPGGGRYRVTVMRLRSGCSFTARIIPFSISSFEGLGLPDSANLLTHWAQGLVLVTGPAGCGKSTTLATLVENINQNRNEHIITIENPIETIFPVGQSQICQRQVGMHTLTQENALRGALRQDPDILMVSELRDMESIQLAVSAAETGHLVFGTMNTINASRTIYRLIESFPADEQDVLRNMISESLRGVISQQLVPRKDGTGVIPVFEVLIITPAVANMIRKNEMHQLASAMITGRNQGMILFDDSLMALVKDGTISAEEAFSRANDPEQFKALLSGKVVNNG